MTIRLAWGAIEDLQRGMTCAFPVGNIITFCSDVWVGLGYYLILSERDDIYVSGWEHHLPRPSTVPQLARSVARI